MNFEKIGFLLAGIILALCLAEVVVHALASAH